jgi:hypothetical protein
MTAPPPTFLSGHAGSLLATAGALDAAAALLHLGCILVGAPAYRALGAGRAMAEMAAAGHWYPTVVTLIIAALLSTCAIYAFAGAGWLAAPPLLKPALAGISLVFLLRALMAVPAFLAERSGAAALHVAGAGGSIAFWYWSSAICLVLGLLHLLGLAGSWSRL